jgi:hypothetical protein
MADMMPDEFDRTLGALEGLPDTAKTRPSTIRTMPFMGVGGSTLHIVQTVRQKLTRVNKKGEEVPYSQDIIFLEQHGAAGNFRLVLPPEVADVIARQRDALGTISRKRTGREIAAANTAGLERYRKARKKRS